MTIIGQARRRGLDRAADDSLKARLVGRMADPLRRRRRQWEAAPAPTIVGASAFFKLHSRRVAGLRSGLQLGRCRRRRGAGTAVGLAVELAGGRVGNDALSGQGASDSEEEGTTTVRRFSNHIVSAIQLCSSRRGGAISCWSTQPLSGSRLLRKTLIKAQKVGSPLLNYKTPENSRAQKQKTKERGERIK